MDDQAAANNTTMGHTQGKISTGGEADISDPKKQMARLDRLGQWLGKKRRDSWDRMRRSSKGPRNRTRSSSSCSTGSESSVSSVEDVPVISPKSRKKKTRFGKNRVDPMANIAAASESSKPDMNSDHVDENAGGGRRKKQFNTIHVSSSQSQSDGDDGYGADDDDGDGARVSPRVSPRDAEDNNNGHHYEKKYNEQPDPSTDLTSDSETLDSTTNGGGGGHGTTSICAVDTDDALDAGLDSRGPEADMKKSPETYENKKKHRPSQIGVIA